MAQDNISRNINWYPGHMAKAKREIIEHLKLVDLVIELRDARIPYSSANPIVDEIIGNKPRLILLNKSDLADNLITNEWINYYKSKNILALDIDAVNNYNIKNIIKYAKIALEDLFNKREAKGIKNKTIKAMILGIPNVGKSTLINTLAKRKALKVGDKPGVTKTESWININDELLLLDTPGILWPKFEDQSVGLKLAFCGSIRDEILDLEFIAYNALEYIRENYPIYIINRYKIDMDVDKIKEMEMEDLITEISKKRGFLIKGGKVDTSRFYNMLINELRACVIGRISYEKPQL